MKTGKTLTELAAEIERQQNAKRDLVASAPAISMVAEDGSKAVKLRVGDTAEFGVNGTAHDQIGQYVGIPAKYYDKMAAEAPQLLVRNVNEWMGRSKDKRLVRTMDGNVRALLSDGYRPLENYDLANAILPILLDQKLEIMSCEITERRLYIKAVDIRIHRDVPSGHRMGDGTHKFFDTCSPAIIVSNSEIGYGQLSVESGVFTKGCTNMALIAEGGMKRRHVGARHSLGDAETLRELLSDETKRVTDKAIFMQVQDVVKGAFDELVFGQRVEKLAALSSQEITGDVNKVVELTAKHFSMTETEKGGILSNLIKGGDLTRYGLFNAITRTAQDLPDYDRATEFERFGGNIIELPKNDWERLAVAA